MVEPLRALTVRQPWAWLIAAGWKPLENRSWAPPSSLVGQRLVIHASQKAPTRADVAWARRVLGKGVELGPLHRGAVVGVVTVAGLVERKRHLERDVARWWRGPMAWALTLPAEVGPVACKGQLGVWRLPPEVVKQLGVLG